MSQWCLLKFLNLLQYALQEGDSKKKYRSNPLSVTSVCFSFVWANHIKGNGIDKTVHGQNCKLTSPLEVLSLM